MSEIKPCLKPCPFCGGPAYEVRQTRTVYGSFFSEVTCARCGASLKEGSPESMENAQAHAAEKWNRRVQCAIALGAGHLRSLTRRIPPVGSGSTASTTATTARPRVMGDEMTPVTEDKGIDWKVDDGK